MRFDWFELTRARSLFWRRNFRRTTSRQISYFLAQCCSKTYVCRSGSQRAQAARSVSPFRIVAKSKQQVRRRPGMTKVTLGLSRQQATMLGSFCKKIGAGDEGIVGYAEKRRGRELDPDGGWNNFAVSFPECLLTFPKQASALMPSSYRGPSNRAPWAAPDRRARAVKRRPTKFRPSTRP